MLKAKLKAAGIHAIATLIVASTTAALVFIVWYPGAFSEMVSGADLFLLVIAVEVVLGPTISLVVFNPKKRRAELLRDYCIVGAIQLAALAYGLYTVAISRPAYLVFVKDRIEVVAPVELSEADLQQAGMSHWSLPWTGPKLVCTESPTDPREKSDLIVSGLEGKDIQLYPKYYRPCKPGEITAKMYSKDQWEALTEHKLSAFPDSVQAEPFGWLPIVSRFGAWVAVYPDHEIDSVVYFDVNPFYMTEDDAP